MTNYILRIQNDEWANMVFGNKVYYTSMRRKWENVHKIMFVKKIKEGDSIIGYGIIDKIDNIVGLNDNVDEICKENNWKIKLTFSKMVRFEPPILIKDTEIVGWPQKGALLHGAPISNEQFDNVIRLGKIRITC